MPLQAAARAAFALVPVAYLIGLMRGRMARIGVSDLAVALGRGLEPGRLRDALAQALRDPSLELGYWRRGTEEYVDVAGRRVDIVPTATRAVTMLERHGRPVAALVHDPALLEDRALLDAVSNVAGLALDNEQLLAELRAQLEETRDSRARIVDAGDTERRRLERNLHDGAQQSLVTLSLHLRMAQECLHSDPAAAAAMLDDVGAALKLALSEIREIARGLHPAMLTDRGLLPALQSLANRATFPVEITGVPATRFPLAIEVAAYYVVAESLTNAARHADATEATVELSATEERLTVEIRDNGCGGASLQGGSGIRGLADRVEALGGRPRAAQRRRRPAPRCGRSCRCAELAYERISLIATVRPSAADRSAANTTSNVCTASARLRALHLPVAVDGVVELLELRRVGVVDVLDHALQLDAELGPAVGVEARDLVRPELAVEDRPVAADEVHPQVVRLVRVDHRRDLADRAVRVAQHRHRRGGVLVGREVRVRRRGLVARHLGDVVAHEQQQAVQRVAAGGQQRRAAAVAPQVPLVLADLGPDVVVVVDLGVVDGADQVAVDEPLGGGELLPEPHLQAHAGAHARPPARPPRPRACRRGRDRSASR